MDTVWDAIHTFIRPPAAALLAYSAAGAAPAEWRWAAALLAGGVALTHPMERKPAARAAVNTTPRPFSNWALSFGEDVLAVWLTWMATAHPIATTVIVVALLALSVFLLFHLFRFARRAAALCLQPESRPTSNTLLANPSNLLVPKPAVLWLQNPVPFIWKNNQFRRHALPLQCIEKFQRLRVRHAIIPLSRNHQRRRFVFPQVSSRKSAAPTCGNFPGSSKNAQYI